MSRSRARNSRCRPLAELGVVAALVLSAGCHSPPRNPYDPSERLPALLASWRETRSNGWSCEESAPRDTPIIDCERIRDEIEKMAYDFPRNVPVLFANAVVSFEHRRYGRSQMFLDTLFDVQPAHADAAVLRSQIAVREGNMRFARRLLDEQIQLTPDHAGLREARAAVFYLTGDLEEADRELRAALRLGAPEARIAYHRGLVAEAGDRMQEAGRHYARAVELDPEDRRAAGRLRGIDVGLEEEPLDDWR